MNSVNKVTLENCLYVLDNHILNDINLINESDFGDLFTFINNEIKKVEYHKLNSILNNFRYKQYDFFCDTDRALLKGSLLALKKEINNYLNKQNNKPIKLAILEE